MIRDEFKNADKKVIDKNNEENDPTLRSCSQFPAKDVMQQKLPKNYGHRLWN